MSAITEAEVETGIALRPPGRRRDLLRLAADTAFGEFAGRCRPLDCAAAPIYAEILARSKRLGRPTSVEDALIATIARRHGFQLATRNGTDFDFLDDLALVDPWRVP